MWQVTARASGDKLYAGDDQQAAYRIAHKHVQDTTQGVTVSCDGEQRCEISKCNQIEDGEGNVRLEILP